MRPKPRVITGGKVVTNEELVIDEAKTVEPTAEPQATPELKLKKVKVVEDKSDHKEVKLDLTVKERESVAETETAHNELTLGPVVEAKLVEDDEVVVIDEAQSKAKPKKAEVDRKKDLAEIMKTPGGAFSSLMELYESTFDPSGNPEKGWYTRQLHTKGTIDILNPRLDEALDILLDDLERRVESGKVFNGTVFAHLEYPVRNQGGTEAKVEIDHTAEKQACNEIWNYTGDDYIVFEMWLRNGEAYSAENVRKVEVARVKNRDEAVRVFMNQRQTVLNKYESGEYEIGELSITVPHLNALPTIAYSGLPATTKPKKCRVKECQCNAEPGRAWCKTHIEQKNQEAASKPKRVAVKAKVV